MCRKIVLNIFVLVLVLSAIGTRFITPVATVLAAIKVERDHSLKQSGASVKNPEDLEFVSVVYDPNVTSYPEKNQSPYGPDVSPVYNLVKKALSQLNPENPGNPLSNVVEAGDVVVLKPNFAGKSDFKGEGVTRTPVLRPLVDFAVQAGASKVIIAEGSSYPYLDDVLFGPDYSNVTGLVEDLQNMHPSVIIDYKNLNGDNFTWVELKENSTFYGVYTAQQLYSLNNIRMDNDSYYYAQDCNGYNPEGYQPGLYAITNTILDADVFINVPKMKIHAATGVTISLKNLIGITISNTTNTLHEETVKDIPHWNNSDLRPGENFTRRDSFENDVIWRVMADLNKIVQYANENGELKFTKQRKYLSLVDAIIGMEGPYIYGPSGVPHPTGAIVAGRDPVAVDAVCSRIMGFNYTVLRSITNMATVTDHVFGKTDPASICVVGTPLNNETFWKSYVPHRNYEEPQTTPYKIRLQCFDPPKMEFIKTHPGTPRDDMETKVMAYTLNMERVASGWLNYSLNETETQILKMFQNENALIANIDKLGMGTNISCTVYLQDFFFNTGWSAPLETSVVPSTYPCIEILAPRFGFYGKNVTLKLNVTKGQQDIHTVWYTVNESSPTTIEAPYITKLALINGSYLIKSYVNDTLGYTAVDIVLLTFFDQEDPLIDIPVHRPEEPLGGENVMASVNVSDDGSGIREVVLSYSMDDGVSWSNVTMNYNYTTGLYDGLIPGQSVGVVVNYKIIAYDNAENFAVNDNTGKYYTYAVVPEFMVLPLLMLTILIVIMVLMKRRTRRT